MYIWEVIEVSPYDEIFWQVLIKDDDSTLEKIKEVILKNLECSWEEDNIRNLKIIDDYFEIDKGSTTIEVTKKEVV